MINKNTLNILLCKWQEHADVTSKKNIFKLMELIKPFSLKQYEYPHEKSVWHQVSEADRLMRIARFQNNLLC